MPPRRSLRGVDGFWIAAVRRMWFDSWSAIGRILLVGTLAYGALIAMLRSSGKRTLAKMNAFDLVITVALGSTLSAIVLDKQIALASGIAALALLIGLQYLVAWSCARSRRVERIVKAEPQLVFQDGVYCDEALRRERLTRSEVDAAIRAHGVGHPAQVRAVVLETDGSFTAVSRAADAAPTALASVYGPSAEFAKVASA